MAGRPRLIAHAAVESYSAGRRNDEAVGATVEQLFP
jgi:hypothetical protein